MQRHFFFFKKDFEYRCPLEALDDSYVPIKVVKISSHDNEYWKGKVPLQRNQT